MIEPVGQLSPQDWMSWPATQWMMDRLNSQGESRFIGGCVRDGVLNLPVTDVDIATVLLPPQVMACLQDDRVRLVPTGLDHGTVTAVLDGHAFEITTLRRDVQTDGRHALVAFTDDWALDAARRDFTINTLSADRQGRIYDPCDGLADLGQRRVRFVGDAMTRIDEDVLRLLRFFRFSAHYGRGALDGRGVTACRKLAYRLCELSGERVTRELVKLLQAFDPAAVLGVMRSEGILAHLLPSADQVGRLKVLTWLETRALVRPNLMADPMRRLASLLSSDGAGAAQRLKLSNADRDRLVVLVDHAPGPTNDLSDRHVRHMVYAMGNDLTRDMILIIWAGLRARGEARHSDQTRAWVHRLDVADGWPRPHFPVGGGDCLDLGLAPGPQVGRLLQACKDWWIAGDFAPSRADCLAWLQTHRAHNPA